MKIKNPIILAVDTSCDETSVAVVRDAQILSNVVSSQIRYHAKYGGVVPFLAQRLHKERIDHVIEIALKRSGFSSISDVDFLAVTIGPGLAPALEVGVEKIRQLSVEFKKPILPVNHMAGHIAGALIEAKEYQYPVLGVLVSGGHTEFVLADKWGEFKILGQTLDDALGEAYDKVAKMLGLPYPGGKLIADLAEKGNADVYELPIPMRYSKDFNISYSGLKNAVRLLILDVKKDLEALLNREQMENISACFEKVAQEALLIKLKKILDVHEVATVVLAGGVASNINLRKKVRSITRERKLQLLIPKEKKLCTDNAAMIGMAAFLDYEESGLTFKAINVDRQPDLDFESIM